MISSRIGATTLALILTASSLMPPAAYAQSASADTSNSTAYFAAQRARLERALDQKINRRPAKNVILFIGDGMGVNSVTAGRIFAGQQRNLDGASYHLSFDDMPFTGLSKTYSADKLVTDSANGISAIMTGVKTINAAIGVDSTVAPKDCASAKKAFVPTIAEQAKARGLKVGVVTTAGITDATPAGAYGHVPFRGWRSDADLPPEAMSLGCLDLARQLVEAPDNIRLDVALGGDRLLFLPAATTGGKRKDMKDLTQVWAAQPDSSVVTDNTSLEAAVAKHPKKLLGLFADGDLPSPVDTAAHENVPTLAEMTAAAIETLSHDGNGYFLLVESASIDKWHHHNNAYRALTDVDELSKAVAVAQAMTNDADTLIIVTADHSHSLTMSAGSDRAEPILGLVRAKGQNLLDRDGHPRLTLNYATGPGAATSTAPRSVPTESQALEPDFLQYALAPTDSAQHAGEDVPVYASGPQSYLLTGTFESSYIYQVMAHALRLDQQKTTSKRH